MRIFLTFIRAIVSGETNTFAAQLNAAPGLATATYGKKSPSIFYRDIAHYMYGGDTALHLASASCRPEMIEQLLAAGANVCATNRRGAGPLHYAADSNRADPATQVQTIASLIAAGADSTAVDKSGVAPLHRAVRTRSTVAVRALLDGGANVNQKNRSGSTPLFLARHNTGKSGSGSPESRERRAAIEALLIERGATLK